MDDQFSIRSVLSAPSPYPKGLGCDETLSNQAERSAYFAEACESPIERKFAMAFTDHTRVQTFAADAIPEDFHEHTLVLIPQLPIGRFRLDFAILFKIDSRLTKWAIECDGKQWHSSFDQVERDLKRDRLLAIRDWRVLRFTGAELFHSAGAMADRVHEEINAFKQGIDASSIDEEFDPQQFEDAGMYDAAEWYRETRPIGFTEIYS
jgi:very-short-patch-repair endonuclease